MKRGVAMSKEKRRVPKLRFPGFTEDWEQRKLGDFTNQINTFVNPEDAKLPLWSLTAEAGLIEKSDRYERDFLVKKKDQFKRIETNTLVYNPMNITIGSIDIYTGLYPIAVSGYYVSIVYDKNIDTDFLKEVLLLPSSLKMYKNYATGSLIERQRVQYPTFSKLQLLLPNLDEQKAIGQLFKSLNLNITLHQRKLKHLNLKKKALLQKLFPKNGECYPELRFPGFTDAWEQRKLESLFTKYEDKVNTPDSGYWRLGLRSHCKGTFHTYVDAGHELETTEMYRVKAGNFILNITFAWERALAVTNNEDQGKLVSHRFPQFKPNSELAIDFFKHTLMDKRFKHHLELSSPGGAGRNKVLKVSDMLKYELLVPSVQEQNIISSFLNKFDYIITLHQRKLDHLQLQKKALLQQMFV